MKHAIFHPLALWDAPFLPGPQEIETSRALAEARTLPFLARRQLGAQLLAALGFFVDQGFYPSRRLWQTARFTLTKHGAALHLSIWPYLKLEDDTLSRRLASGSKAELLPWLSLRPLFPWLLPEYREVWQDLPKEEDPWHWPKWALTRVLDHDRSGKTLAHPQGWGRFLWARRFALPSEGGVFYCLEEPLLGRLSPMGATVGRFAEAELGALWGRSFAETGEGKLVVTSLPLPGVKPLPLSSPPAFWCFLPPGGEKDLAQFLAGGPWGDPQEMGRVFSQWVGMTWGRNRENVAGAEGLLSPGAARLLAVLRGTGLGLTPEEAAAVVPEGKQALEELARFSLVNGRFGRFWARTLGRKNPRLLDEVLPRLREGPLAWVGQLVRGEDGGLLEAWCARKLEAEEPEAVLAMGIMAEGETLEEALVEAALGAGWLGYAEGPIKRLSGPIGKLLKAWWLAETGVTRELAVALKELTSDEEAALPRRLQLRALLLRAQLAERQGRWEEAVSWAQQLLCCKDLLFSLRVEACYFLGQDHLEALTRYPGIPPEVKSRALHLLGVKAFAQGHYPEAEKLFKQALLEANGKNPLRFGELLADAASTSMLSDKPLAAECLYSAAETWLRLAGCQRGLRVVRFNRATLANDRLNWQKAQELLPALASLEALEALYARVEWARSFLVQGELEKAREVARPLREAMAGGTLPENLRQGAATVFSHLALFAQGPHALWLEEVTRWVTQAEPSERRLLQALLASGEEGTVLEGLPHRWGLAFSARLFQLARDAPEALAEHVATTFANPQKEALLGLVRALLLAPRWGVELMPYMRPYLPQLRKLLRAQGLGGWVTQLELRFGRDWVAILDSLQSFGHPTGAAFWQVSRWQPLLENLRLSSLRILHQGQVLVAVGEGPPRWRGNLRGFELEVGGSADDEILGVMGLLLSRAPLPSDGSGPLAPVIGITGSSKAVRALKEAIAQVAPLPVTVLVQGEPGTGKERVAKAIHEISGRLGEFVAVNCAGLPESLLEAELFGVVRGAFTGADRDRPGLVEQAEGGTLFLDEVGELPLGMQAKLLRLLQEKEVRRVGGTRVRKVDVRFVAATNRNLREAVQARSFRRDLFDRLATVTLEVPPLRERLEDLPFLVWEVLSSFSSQLGLKTVSVAEEVVLRLREHAWPGNVRELESVLLQALIRCQPGGHLEVHHLPWDKQVPVVPLVPFTEAKQAYIREYFKHLLALCGGNRTQAAKLAGLSRQALHYHLRILGLHEG